MRLLNGRIANFVLLQNAGTMVQRSEGPIIQLYVTLCGMPYILIVFINP